MHADVNKVYFYDCWCESLRTALKSLLFKGVRVEIFYSGGFSQVGYLTASSGDIKHPMVLHNRKSSGGTLLFRDILKITASRKGGKVYWDMERDEPILWVHTQ